MGFSVKGIRVRTLNIAVAVLFVLPISVTLDFWVWFYDLLNGIVPFDIRLFLIHREQIFHLVFWYSLINAFEKRGAGGHDELERKA